MFLEWPWHFLGEKILANSIQLRADIRHFVVLLPCQGSASLDSIEFRAPLNVTACVMLGPVWQYLFHTKTERVMSASADKKNLQYRIGGIGCTYSFTSEL